MMTHVMYQGHDQTEAQNIVNKFSAIGFKIEAVLVEGLCWVVYLYSDLHVKNS